MAHRPAPKRVIPVPKRAVAAAVEPPTMELSTLHMQSRAEAGATGATEAAAAVPPKRVMPKLRVKAASATAAVPATSIPAAAAEPSPAADESEEEDIMAFPLYDLRNHAGLAVDTVNESIVDLMSRLITLAEGQRAASTGSDKAQHTRRINSFVAARDAIRDYKPVIKSGAQAQREINKVGKGIADRIDEFLRTGTLQELEEAIDPEAKILLELATVTGIGPERARSLRKDFGVTSVDDLIDKYRRGIIKVKANQLTHHSVVGLQYHYDIQQRMPWAEADQISHIIIDTVRELDPRLTVTICGSYRRMRPTCGDIDVLISHPDIDSDEAPSPLTAIVRALTDVGLLVGHLTEDGKTKYMGICKVDQHPETLGRRIDIRFVPYSSQGAAILYFTGSGKFNKIMRYYANTRGYTLNEYGLYHYHGGVRGDLVAAPTERDIFKILRFVYLDPTQREF